MSTKFLSPGQKRKRTIKRSCFLMAFLSLTLAYFIPGPSQVTARKLEQNHQSAPISILSVSEGEETTRGRRGRKTTTNVIYLEYEYEAEGQKFLKTKTLSENDYFAFKDISVPEVWFQQGYASDAELAGEVKANASRTPVQRVFGFGIIALPVIYVLNILLGFLFGREPKGYLPKGFYTESSWLDIEDNVLVVLNSDSLNIASFERKNADVIQTRYQSGNTLNDIVTDISVTQTSIPLANIICVESDHYKDTIYIEYKVDNEEKPSSLEFLSATVKAHALDKISASLPPYLTRKDKQFTRLGSAKGKLVFTASVAILTIYFADIALVLALGAIASLYFMKSSAARLIDPTFRSQWVKEG